MAARRLSLAARTPVDPGDAALDALADALFPRLLARLGAERQEQELVDVIRAVPGSKRRVMHACRTGEIAGASKVAPLGRPAHERRRVAARSRAAARTRRR